MAERMVSDRGAAFSEETRNPHRSRDEKVLINLQSLVADSLEVDWRNYETEGIMPMRKKNEPVGFAPKYVACPAPVKINPAGGWDPDNIKRCKKTPPGNYSGKQQRVWAYVHMLEEHVDWWIEVNSMPNDPQRAGETRPPLHTKATLPGWVDLSDPNALRTAEMTEFERAVEEQKKKYRGTVNRQANAKKARESIGTKGSGNVSEEPNEQMVVRGDTDKEEEGES